MQLNKTSDYSFTIIVPVYNEKDNMDTVEKVLREYLPTAPCSACVLFVDDGSADGSTELIEKICERNEHMFYISFVHNCGLSAAIKAGIDYSQSQYIGYIDADLQTSPQDFNLLLPKIKDYALVNGIRANRKDTKFKRLQSKIANGFRRKMTGDRATDTGCPLKVLQAGVAKNIPFFKGMHRFLPALVTLQAGAKYTEMPVRHFPRMAGKSKFHLSNRLVGPFIDCFAFRWMKSRYINYTVNTNDIGK